MFVDDAFEERAEVHRQEDPATSESERQNEVNARRGEEAVTAIAVSC